MMRGDEEHEYQIFRGQIAYVMIIQTHKCALGARTEAEQLKLPHLKKYFGPRVVATAEPKYQISLHTAKRWAKYLSFGLWQWNTWNIYLMNKRAMAL